MCSQQPASVLHQIQQCLCFSKMTHFQKPHVCWLDSITIKPSCETKNTVKNLNAQFLAKFRNLNLHFIKVRGGSNCDQ